MGGKTESQGSCTLRGINCAKWCSGMTTWGIELPEANDLHSDIENYNVEHRDHQLELAIDPLIRVY